MLNYVPPDSDCEGKGLITVSSIRVPGKQLCTPDTLSRSLTTTAGPVSLSFQNELIVALVATFTASCKKIKQYEKT